MFKLNMSLGQKIARRSMLSGLGFSLSIPNAIAPTLGESSRHISEVNVRNFGAVGDGSADDAPKFQAAIDALDKNRGGRILVPEGRYRFGMGVLLSTPGTELCGEGMPGVCRSIALGTSRIIVDHGLTAFTCNPIGAHATLGYAFRRLHILSAQGATSGNGILIRDTSSCIIEDTTCSDFIAGFGLCIDGGDGNSQYTELRNFSAGDCMTGLKLTGSAPNGCRMFGGYFEGVGASPRPGSKGVHILRGDTFRGFGIVIQGFETGFHLESGALGHELYGPRFEYCNIGLRLGPKVRSFKLVGGSFSNSLLANPSSGSIGIVID